MEANEGEWGRNITNGLDIKKPAGMQVLGRSRTMANYILVEAGGIEPPSVNPLPEGATCLVTLLV